MEPRLIDTQATIARLDKAGRIALTTHARADGDALGCALSLARVLRGQGKQVTAYLHEPVTDRYAFLTEGEPVEVWQPASAADEIAKADLFVVLDTCSRPQLGEIAAALDAAAIHKLAIDHHVTRDDVVDEILVDETAAACAQIILGLCESADWPIDAAAAEMLFVGLATDTGWFRFSNADTNAYAAAARLVQRGARPNQLYERLYLNESVARARLSGAALSTFELHAGGRLAVIPLTREQFAACAATPAMTEDVINEPQRVGSVIAAVMAVEPEPGDPVRVSFRSKRVVDVAAVAAGFGGGGHQRAAGAKISGPFADVVKQVTAAMVDALEREDRSA